MNRKLLPTLVLTFALAACASNPPADAPVAATTEAAAPAPVATAAKPDRDDGMICRMESTIGSNRMKRVCRAKADVDKEARQTQDVVRRMQKSGARISN